MSLVDGCDFVQNGSPSSLHEAVGRPEGPPQEMRSTSFRAEGEPRVNGLRLLAANSKFDIEFYDDSVRTPYYGTGSNGIHRRSRKKINRASVTVCMVKALSRTGPWDRMGAERTCRQ